MEVRLSKFTQIVDSVVRLHNFCRARLVDVPDGQADNVSMPAYVSFKQDGGFDNEHFEPAPVRQGRPAVDQASLSKPRDEIRAGLDIQGMMRPAHNRARNRNR